MLTDRFMNQLASESVLMSKCFHLTLGTVCLTPLGRVRRLRPGEASTEPK